MTARPWSEGVALLAAHGFAAPPPRSEMFKPRNRRLGDGIRYALWTDDRNAKPSVFLSIDALARRIHRERGDATLEIKPVEDLEIEGADGLRPGFSVFTEYDGHRVRLIGHVWIDGQSRDVLQAAIRRNRPAQGSPLKRRAH